MKRSVILIRLCAAALLPSLLAAPAAMAGTDIVKCVDAGGHVTLTDQPCDAGMSSERLGPASASGMQPVAQHYVLPATALHQGGWKRPDLSHALPLKQDVATLKEARRMLMLEDARPRLAGLQ